MQRPYLKALQRMVGRGRDKNQQAVSVGFPQLLCRLHARHAIHINIQKCGSKGCFPCRFQKCLAAFVFQNIRLYKELSVIDNIKVGLHESMKYNLGSSLIRLPNYWKEEKRCTERAFELLDIFHMADLADAQAGSLPYGAQRRLEIMRALATSPKLLLLDEPAAGMNPSETAELTETIRRIRDEFNIAVLLIEHDMSLVMGICEGIAVLNFGRIIAKGTPDEIRNNPQVIEAYLGKKEG